jgi:hypothetical protein
MFFRKKPVVVEAFLWTGGPDQTEDPEWIIEAIKRKEVWFKNEYDNTNTAIECHMYIKTLEGNHMANTGDYIIKGVKGEIYPCKPDIFQLTYEEAPRQELRKARKRSCNTASMQWPKLRKDNSCLQ